ncbi:MAG: hypothetical protein HZB87_08575 [Desulfatitalea sp.]|nr:hypothetical protein [Desulfatitalea sp.]
MSSPHLTHDELLKAVVDAADLAAEKSMHLEVCPVCRDAREHLQVRFLRLGRTARELAPAPTRPFRLTDNQAPAAARRLKPLWAMGFVAAMLLAIVAGRSMWPSYSAPIPTAAMLEADRRLGEAVDALVEDALPVTFQHLASLDAEETEVDPQIDEDDEELIDWVVPPVEAEDDSLT